MPYVGSISSTDSFEKMALFGGIGGSVQKQEIPDHRWGEVYGRNAVRTTRCWIGMRSPQKPFERKNSGMWRWACAIRACDISMGGPDVVRIRLGDMTCDRMRTAGGAKDG